MPSGGNDGPNSFAYSIDSGTIFIFGRVGLHLECIGLSIDDGLR